MASDKETFADAVAAERRRIERAKADAEEDLEIECTFIDEEVIAILDRVEAAHRREIAELSECLNEATERLCQPCPYRHGKECADCDDVQKWRKALAEAAGESDAKTSCGCEGGR